MNVWIKDLRYGVRMLLKSPGSTAAALLALALGIGANTAIFSVVNAVLLRPLHYKDPDRLVFVWEAKPSKAIARENVSPPDFADWIRQSHAFDQLAALRSQPAVLTSGALAERVETAQVSSNLFDLLGVKTVRGRTFSAEEGQPDRDRVAILSYGLWQRRYGGDAGILGQPVTVDGVSYNIIGITGPEFRLLDSPSELWLPYTLDSKEESQRGFHTLQVVGRLRAGVGMAQAQSEMQAIASGLERQYPESNAGWTVTLVPLRDQLVGDLRTTLWTLLAAVVFVLLIACANVANLLLARAGSREKEIALRTSLGANPWRLVRQLLTESLVLSLAGGVLGLLLGAWSSAALSRFGPASLARMQEIGIDGRVLGFTLAVSILTGIVFGLAPALAMIRPDLNSVLRASGRGTTGSRRRARMRDALVVSEIVCCVVLLSGAGLLIRSFVGLERVDPGFHPERVLTMQLTLPEARYAGWNVAAFYQRLIGRLETLSGVREAGIARNLPLSGADASLNFTIENRPVEASADQARAKYRSVSAGYFTALGIPVERGRAFNQNDGEKTPGVAVINRAMARRFWPGQDPIGQRIKPGFDDSVWCTIVGIVGDVKHAGLDAAANPEAYYLYLQTPPALMTFVEGTMTLVLRTSGDPETMVSGVREAVRALDPNLAVFNVHTMDDLLDDSLAQPRFRTLLLAAFAGVALILAGIGLYGVIAYSVTQRTNEMGVRMALGAQKNDVLKMVLGEGALLAGIGIAIGLAIGLALMQVISRLLFGVNARDPLTFAATALVIFVVALAASLFPALRAIRVDPMVALRYE
jgi:putative ABC transport system permease protein